MMLPIRFVNRCREKKQNLFVFFFWHTKQLNRGQCLLLFSWYVALSCSMYWFPVCAKRAKSLLCPCTAQYGAANGCLHIKCHCPCTQAARLLAAYRLLQSFQVQRTYQYHGQYALQSLRALMRTTL